jgi:3-oxoacyl-[acyl-carrier protein] reductase
MNLQLDQRVALVTAASQGLGYATALQLSREGALVAICSRDEARITAAADAIHAETRRPVLGVRADVSKAADIKRLVGRVVDEYGGLDILVANAGGPPAVVFADATDTMWQQAFDQLTMSTVRLIREALPHLRQSSAPSVLTITSVAVKQPIIDIVLSSSLRLAVVGLTKTLALELGPERIRFNSILPGSTETERIQEMLETRARRNGCAIEEEAARYAEASALGRMATPQEFANVATFLVSPAASYVTGVMVPVDGGSYKGVY